MGLCGPLWVHLYGTNIGAPWITPDPRILDPSKWTGPIDQLHTFYYFIIFCFHYKPLKFVGPGWSPKLGRDIGPTQILQFPPRPIPKWARRWGDPVLTHYVYDENMEDQHAKNMVWLPFQITNVTSANGNSHIHPWSLLRSNAHQIEATPNCQVINNNIGAWYIIVRLKKSIDKALWQDISELACEYLETDDDMETTLEGSIFPLSCRYIIQKYPCWVVPGISSQ